MQIKSERENDSFVPVGAAHYRSGNQSRDQGFLPPSLPFFALRCSALGTSLDDSLIYGVKKDENVGFSRAVRLLLVTGLQAMFPNNYAGFMSLMSHRIDRAQMMG